MGLRDLDEDDICSLIIIGWMLLSSLMFAIIGWLLNNTNRSSEALEYFGAAIIMAFIGISLLALFLIVYAHDD